ncbi:TadE/TadG family type IV pilus assembly protein [Saccharopolyspora antimicrobica]|uniref:TadE/TadG family type IV pilus assembly protein n=1 Tax=Saccharopolyspora antimicrobica TaxID=455193 RepID=UPI001476C797|nr:TadE/TadG family type IV pilus assembly protein [Saccharopolyspora antimicrobica]
MELAVLTPMLLMIIMFSVAVGRILTADLALVQATTAAARAASLARTPGAAHSAATRVGAQVLAEQELACHGIQAQVDTGRFGAVGLPGHVTVTLRCTVSLSDLTGIPGLPAGLPVQKTFGSPVDPFRSRT